MPTKSCNISCSAGPHSAPAMPCSTSSTQAFQIVKESVRNSTPQAIETNMNNACPAWITRRQSKRSASAAEVDAENSRNGTQ